MAPKPREGFVGLAPAELVRAASIARRFFIDGCSKSDIAGVYAALSQSAQPTERSLAEFMKLEGLLHDDQDQTK